MSLITDSLPDELYRIIFSYVKKGINNFEEYEEWYFKRIWERRIQRCSVSIDREKLSEYLLSKINKNNPYNFTTKYKGNVSYYSIGVGIRENGSLKKSNGRYYGKGIDMIVYRDLRTMEKFLKITTKPDIDWYNEKQNKKVWLLNKILQ